MSNDEVITSGSLSALCVDPRIMRLAERLAAIHGPVTIADESSGIHIHIADPEQVLLNGMKELSSKHVCINAEKYLGIGRYDVDEYPTRENKELYTKYRSKGKEVPGTCSMKTGKLYSVRELLNMPKINKRLALAGEVKSTVSIGAQSNQFLVKDENGNMVPEWVAHTIPLTKLPSNHPAIIYLKSRGFDPLALQQQFEACYCDKALPEDRSIGRYYSRLPGGMKNTPQGRIIFSVRMDGSRWGYQSRAIDMWFGDRRFFWSHNNRWELVATRNPDGTITERYPKDVRFPKGFAPHKYLNCQGSSRNRLLMGFDAAVESQKDKPFNERYCILVEGPLDAGKIGPPGIALLGKSMSDIQAEYIRKRFSKVYTMMDNDVAGEQCLRKIKTKLPNTNIIEIKVPDRVKDVGDLSYEEVKELITPYTNDTVNV